VKSSLLLGDNPSKSGKDWLKIKIVGYSDYIGMINVLYGYTIIGVGKMYKRWFSH